MYHQFKKQFGQNFLRKDRFVKALVSELSLEADDTVLEVGPGQGKVTAELLKKAMTVVAVEVDYQLIPQLAARFPDLERFKLIHADILKVDLVDLKIPKKYKLVGSLPYNISKQIIRMFATHHSPPEIMAVIVQAEVAKEYNCQPPKATFLSNWIKIYANVRKAETIPAQNFFPTPKVDGGILVISPHKPVPHHSKIERILRWGFASPRKTLRNNLISARLPAEEIDRAWEQLGLTPSCRASEIDFSTWQKISSILKTNELGS